MRFDLICVQSQVGMQFILAPSDHLFLCFWDKATTVINHAFLLHLVQIKEKYETQGQTGLKHCSISARARAQLRKNFLETWFCCQKALIMPRTNVYLVPKISAIMLQSAKYCRQQSYLLRSFVTRALLQTRQAPVWAPGW